MKILCVGYREWAKKIYSKTKKKKGFSFYFHVRKKGLVNKIKKTNPNIILFYGWSWLIDKSIYEKYICFMLHPSKLPKFRGGSPLQNQIIRGIKSSAVTIFKINDKIDGGDIYFQKKLSLEGTLHDIFNRIVEIGVLGTNKILYEKPRIRKQNLRKSSFFKRIKESQSEITSKELKNKSILHIFNKIRMLSDPYPNPYLRVGRKKLIIKNIKIE